MPVRNGSAEWKGDLQSGTGEVMVGNGVFLGAYTARSRFEEGPGTNPEELIAAAEAACFSMQLGNIMAKAGHTPRSVLTHSRVELRPVDGAPTVTRILLDVEGDVPGIDEGQFREFAEQAKRECPISRALTGVNEIVVEPRLSAAAT
jgi:osmotically inducible protein OsmC